MTIVAGPRSRDLAAEMAEASGQGLIVPEHKRFPDGEAYFRIPDALEGEVVLVQNAFPDGGIVELMVLADLIKERGAEYVHLLVPYVGYARQDKSFTTGEAVSSGTVIRHISRSVDAIATVDIHSPSVLDCSDVPAENIYPAESFAAFLNGIDVVLAPDEGAKHRAEAVAEHLDKPWDYLIKVRLDDQHVVMEPKGLDVSGMSVAIVDDIISTGGTIARASEHLRSQGATRVVAACTHGLFTGNAFERMATCDGVHSTKTLMSEASTIAIGAELARRMLGQM